MRSLRKLLIVWTGVGAATILLVAGGLVYVLTRASLVEQFDRGLIDKGRFLAALTEQDAGDIHLDFDKLELSQFGLAEELPFLQVWRSGGEAIYHSPTLGDDDLQRFTGTIEFPNFRWVDLPDGRPGRAVGITFAPPQKHRGGQLAGKKKSESQSFAPSDLRHVATDDTQLVISEFLAANKGISTDENGEDADWIEIHNVGPRAVELDGWYLTDQPTNRTDTFRWRFPRMTLESGAYLVVFASGKNRRDASFKLHTDFKLDADGEYLALLQPDGQTVESAYAPRFPRQVANVSYGISPPSQLPGYYRRPTPGEPNDGEATPEPPEPKADHITLVLARDASTMIAALDNLKAVLMLVGLVSIPALVIALGFAIRRNLRNLERLAGRISELCEDDLSQRIDMPDSPEELQPVIDRLNGLLCQLELAFQRERGFSADVAHELRTPLAGLLMKADLALSRARQPADYHQVLLDCREIATQMRLMVENLMLLAGFEGGSVKLEREAVEVSQLIHDAWEPLAKIARQRRLEVSWSLDRSLRMVTDQAQFQVVVRNVLDNAVTYVDKGGRVSIASRAQNGSVNFRVCNSGSRLSEEDVPHVFDRFWRHDKARTGVGVGVHSGLGLSLTRRIVEGLGGRVAAASSMGGEFIITITLPKDPDAG